MGTATIDYWSLTPAETEALMRAWDQKQKHEAQRFNVLISCITGTPIPTDDTDPEAAKHEFKRILNHLTKSG